MTAMSVVAGQRNLRTVPVHARGVPEPRLPQHDRQQRHHAAARRHSAALVRSLACLRAHCRLRSLVGSRRHALRDGDCEREIVLAPVLLTARPAVCTPGFSNCPRRCARAPAAAAAATTATVAGMAAVAAVLRPPTEYPATASSLTGTKTRAHGQCLQRRTTWPACRPPRCPATSATRCWTRACTCACCGITWGGGGGIDIRAKKIANCGRRAWFCPTRTATTLSSWSRATLLLRWCCAIIVG